VVATPRQKPARDELELRAFKAQQIAERLGELAKSEGWATLVEIFDAAEKSYYQTVTRQLMQGREINQRKLDHNRGVFDGVRQLLEQPAKAESVLAKAIERLSESADTEE